MKFIRNKKLGLGLMVLCLLMALTACGQSKDQGGNSATDDTGKASQGGELTMGVTSFADTLEPTEQYFSWVITRYGVGETLVKFDEQGQAIPGLAKSWSVSDDQLTWTFDLQDGVKFSNGKDMDGAAVKLLWNGPLNYRTGPRNSLTMKALKPMATRS